jgi:hypothetical protein
MSPLLFVQPTPEADTLVGASADLRDDAEYFSMLVDEWVCDLAPATHQFMQRQEFLLRRTVAALQCPRAASLHVDQRHSIAAIEECAAAFRADLTLHLNRLQRDILL